MTNIKTPSLLFQYTMPSIFDNTIDINKLFWKYLFSMEFYDKYINIDSPIKEFIKQTNEADQNIINYMKDFQSTDDLKHSHKIFYSIINFYNQHLFWKNNIHLSVSRSMVMNGIPKLAIDILYDIMNKIVFQKNEQFSLKIYFDNEIYTSLIIAKYLKEKYNGFIEIDTYTKSDEQVDFSSYTELSKHYSFVDRVITYENQKFFKPEKMIEAFTENKLVNTENSAYRRFFKQACFWNKCSFCTINAQHGKEQEIEKEDKTIEKHIKFLKENPKVDYLFFSDEAIAHHVLIKFCKRILEENINVIISLRARYEKVYKETDIEIMGKAGVRFLGIGLESASSRLNFLIQKRDFSLEPYEINKSIDLFNKYKINLHQYFMIGLPSETKEETDMTYNFILDNLENRDYFTYSANVFSLNKGSDIFNNPSKYGIKIGEGFKAQGVPFENISGDRYSYKELKERSNRIYSYMFFQKDEIEGKFNYGYDFWDFLDRTSIFYIQKMIFNKNPYLR